MDGPISKKIRRDSFSVVLAGLDPQGDPSTQVNSYLDSFPNVNSILDTQFDVNEFTGVGTSDVGAPKFGALNRATSAPAAPSSIMNPHDFRQTGSSSNAQGPENVSLFPIPDRSGSLDLGTFTNFSAGQVSDTNNVNPLLGRPIGAAPIGAVNSALENYNSPPPHQHSAPASVYSVPENSGAFVPMTTVKQQSWRDNLERPGTVQRLQLVLREYTADTLPFAQEIEEAAFTNAEDKESYDKLLAIQCYKLRKLARGELQPPPNASSQQLQQQHAAMATLPSPSGKRTRQPSLPFLGDLSASDLLSWQPDLL